MVYKYWGVKKRSTVNGLCLFLHPSNIHSFCLFIFEVNDFCLFSFNKLALPRPSKGCFLEVFYLKTTSLNTPTGGCWYKQFVTPLKTPQSTFLEGMDGALGIGFINNLLHGFRFRLDLGARLMICTGPQGAGLEATSCGGVPRGESRFHYSSLATKRRQKPMEKHRKTWKTWKNSLTPPPQKKKSIQTDSTP